MFREDVADNAGFLGLGEARRYTREHDSGDRSWQMIAEDVVSEVAINCQQREVFSHSIGKQGMVIATAQRHLLRHRFDRMPVGA